MLLVYHTLVDLAYKQSAFPYLPYSWVNRMDPEFGVAYAYGASFVGPLCSNLYRHDVTYQGGDGWHKTSDIAGNID